MTATAPEAPASHRLPLTFILITVVIDSMGIGLILPVMPDLIREVHLGDIAQAALWGGVLTTAYAFMQFVCSPLIGALSDRFGRRPVLLTALFIMALDYILMAVAGALWLLIVARIIGGITAGTQGTASAFVADISKPEEKSARFGLIGAAFGVGFVLGPLMGGLLAEFGTRAPFYAAAALAALNFVFGYVVMPETATGHRRRAFSWARANPFGALRAVSTRPGIGRLILIFFLYNVAFTVYPAVWAFYTTARFDWAPGMIGLSLAAFGVAMAIVQGGLIGFILRVFGERATIRWGILFNLCTFLAYATITSPVLIWVLVPVAALGAVVMPALQGMMSRATPDDAQGELQGVLGSAASLAAVIAPLIMTQIFYLFTREGAPVFMPGAPFFLSAALLIACGAIFWTAGRR